MMPFLLLAGVGLFVYLAARGDGPSIEGLERGAWYSLLYRSSLSAITFGPHAAHQQAQALLGRQGFDLRAAAPVEEDPFLYQGAGIYRGTGGTITSGPGVTLLHAVRCPPLPPAPEEPAHIDARPVPVAPGATYAGRASLSWPATMFVTKERVRDKLLELGFRDVEVYLEAAELPANWPATERGGDLFARATFTRGEGTIAVPSQVVSVWTTAAA